VIDVRRQNVSGTVLGSDAGGTAAAWNSVRKEVGSGLKKSSETFIDPR